jgi:hypothetical protein
VGMGVESVEREEEVGVLRVLGGGGGSGGEEGTVLLWPERVES